MKSFLNEAKEEYICLTSQMQEMENQLKNKNELFAESRERSRDLEEQLTQMQFYSSEQSKKLEILENESERSVKIANGLINLLHFLMNRLNAEVGETMDTDSNVSYCYNPVHLKYLNILFFQINFF